MTTPERERWTLVFQPIDDAIPTPVRVRRLLKFALRALHLRCVGYGEPSRDPPPPTPAEARPPPRP